MVLHVADRQIRADHLRHLPRKAPRSVHHDFTGDLALLGIDLPLPRGQAVDIHHTVVAHNLDAHVGRAPGHRIGQAGRVGMAVVHRPGAGNHAVDVIKRIELFNFGWVDDLHAEANVIRDALHGVEPIKISLLARDANTARGVPAHILTGLFFERGIQPITVIMNLGEVVVTDEAGALPGCVPGRARGQLALLNQHDVGFAFLSEVIRERHPHDAAPDNHNPGLRIDRHTAPPFLCSGAYIPS